MLAQVVPVVQRLSDRTRLRIQRRSEICSARECFKNDSIVRSGGNIFSPGKWPVVRDQNARLRQWIAFAECPQDGFAGVLLILAGDFMIG